MERRDSKDEVPAIQVVSKELLMEYKRYCEMRIQEEQYKRYCLQ